VGVMILGNVGDFAPRVAASPAALLPGSGSVHALTNGAGR
jgi:hypothetical protein